MNHFFFFILLISLVISSTLAKKTFLKGNDGPQSENYQNKESLVESLASTDCINPNSLAGSWGHTYWSTGHIFETGNGGRSENYFISFGNTLCYVPNVIVALTGFDISHDYNQRLVVNTVSVTTTGINIKVDTWADTKIYQVTVRWLAVKA